MEFPNNFIFLSDSNYKEERFIFPRDGGLTGYLLNFSTKSLKHIAGSQEALGGVPLTYPTCLKNRTPINKVLEFVPLPG